MSYIRIFWAGLILLSFSFRGESASLSFAGMRDPVKDPKGHRNGEARGGWADTAVLFGKVSGMGWFLAACIALGTFGGYRVGEWLGVSLWFTIGGLLFGILVAVFGLYRMVKTFWDVSSDDEKAKVEKEVDESGG